MATATFVSGAVKECCQQQSNLYVVEDPTRPDVIIRKCAVCGCRHIRFSAQGLGQRPIFPKVGG